MTCRKETLFCSIMTRVWKGGSGGRCPFHWRVVVQSNPIPKTLCIVHWSAVKKCTYFFLCIPQSLSKRAICFFHWFWNPVDQSRRMKINDKCVAHCFEDQNVIILINYYFQSHDTKSLEQNVIILINYYSRVTTLSPWSRSWKNNQTRRTWYFETWRKLFYRS